jgi:GTP-binding protein
MGTTEKGKEMCWTSAHPGRTREMNAFGIGGTKGGESKIVLLDMPGYGKASRAEWGTEIVKYLKGRKQLRRTFLLIDALHGLKGHDHDLLRLLRHSAIPHQVILSKVDRVLFSSKSQAKTAMKKPNSNTLVFAANIEGLQRRLSDLRMVIQPDARTEGPGALGEILTSSAETRLERNNQRLGVNAVRWAIMTAAGLGERHLGS